jgi:hypothetical protein
LSLLIGLASLENQPSPAMQIKELTALRFNQESRGGGTSKFTAKVPTTDEFLKSASFDRWSSFPTSHVTGLKTSRLRRDFERYDTSSVGSLR